VIYVYDARISSQLEYLKIFCVEGCRRAERGERISRRWVGGWGVGVVVGWGGWWWWGGGLRVCSRCHGSGPAAMAAGSMQHYRTISEIYEKQTRNPPSSPLPPFPTHYPTLPRHPYPTHAPTSARSVCPFTSFGSRLIVGLIMSSAVRLVFCVHGSRKIKEIQSIYF
jgi:hypothetical protein